MSAAAQDSTRHAGTGYALGIALALQIVRAVRDGYRGRYDALRALDPGAEDFDLRSRVRDDYNDGAVSACDQVEKYLERHEGELIEDVLARTVSDVLGGLLREGVA